jgi:hypothetical protein
MVKVNVVPTPSVVSQVISPHGAAPASAQRLSPCLRQGRPGDRHGGFPPGSRAARVAGVSAGLRSPWSRGGGGPACQSRPPPPRVLCLAGAWALAHRLEWVAHNTRQGLRGPLQDTCLAEPLLDSQVAGKSGGGRQTCLQLGEDGGRQCLVPPARDGMAVDGEMRGRWRRVVACPDWRRPSTCTRGRHGGSRSRRQRVCHRAKSSVMGGKGW